MLNIPEEVKTLFKADSVFKNFHVRFPNGEFTDLNNDDIVAESVEFTESICSQQAFRFGLTEASELKFTCVNVPNIRGVTIEAAIEIDVSSLGSAWAEENAPDGTETFLTPQVCTYSDRTMYRVPYGSFIIDTCPRNHESMWKREVTAYTERVEESQIVNPFQTAVMNAFYPNITTYAPYVRPLALSVLAKSETDLLSAGYTKVTLQRTSSRTTLTVTRTLKTTSGATMKIACAPTYNTYYFGTGESYKRAIYSINWGTYGTTDTLQKLADKLESLNFDAEASGYASFYEMAEDFMGDRYMPGFIHEFEDGNIDSVAYVQIPEGSSVMYPYVSPVPDQFGMLAAYLKEIEIRDVSQSTVGILGYVSGLDTVTFSAYADNTANPINAEPLSVGSTLQTTRKGFYTKALKTYSFANAVSLKDLLQGYLELQCQFGSPARSGGMEITALDNSAPVPILPENYAELWYDETTIAPIGYVQVKFKDEAGNDQDIAVRIGSGASLYDLRNNEVLNNMVFTVSEAEAEADVTIESKIINFLNSVFTPNIPDLSFIPIELTKKGLPYLEAGDAIAVTTEDGQTVPSFILRQTIKGIQFLTTDAESANGEAMEMLET